MRTFWKWVRFLSLLLAKAATAGMQTGKHEPAQPTQDDNLPRMAQPCPPCKSTPLFLASKWKPSWGLDPKLGPRLCGRVCIRTYKGQTVLFARFFWWVVDSPPSPNQFILGFTNNIKPIMSVPTNCDSNPASWYLQSWLFVWVSNLCQLASSLPPK